MDEQTKPALLSVRGVELRYGGVPVLAPFDLDLRPGEVVAVLGPSGVGKSSLLRVLGGLAAPHAGQVLMRGQALRGVDPRLAFAFQDPCLLPWLTLEANVAFGLDFKHQPRLSRQERQARVDAAIREVGLEHARRHHPAALSGGMAQRAALARCLARAPDVLLLDEPFAALDEVTRAGMQSLLRRVVADFGTAAVLVTHDIDEALLVADRVLLLGNAPAPEAGGAGARVVGTWALDLPHPRPDMATADLGALRLDILRRLRDALRAASPDHITPEHDAPADETAGPTRKEASPCA